MMISRALVLSVLVACAFVPQVARAAEMTFTLAPVGDPARCRGGCPNVIVAEGEITDATPDAFVNFVQTNVPRGDVRSIVFLNSPGGKVVASMELGRVLRKLGAAAVVARVAASPDQTTTFGAARCFSACVYALMGGKRRVIPPQSQVGIHRMFTYEAGSDPAGGTTRSRRLDEGSMRDALAKYSNMMGVSPELITYAESTSPDTIHVLSPREIARWRLGSPRL